MTLEFDIFFKKQLFKIKEELEKESFEVDESWIFPLVLVAKEDSLLNCLCKINFDEMMIYVKERYQDCNIEYKNEYKIIIEKADGFAEKDETEAINDEHILASILSFRNEALDILSVFIENINEVRLSVDSYFEEAEEQYLVNLTSLANRNKFDPFIGRKEYIDKVIRIISKKQKNNCLLIGSAGVGKSALVEGVVMELIKRKNPVNVYRLELGVIIAGTRYRGDLEERLVEMIKKIKDSKSILFIDEIHNIMGSGRSEDAISIANILKPVLARNEIKCIGATTLDEYYEYIEKDKALCRRFQNIFIPEATANETLDILKKIKYNYEDYYNVYYSLSVLKNIIDCCKYFPNRKFPDKAIDILDEIGAYTKGLNLKKVQLKDIKKIVFENLGVKEYRLKNKIYYQEIIKKYNLFKLSEVENNRKNIMQINYRGKNVNELIKEVKDVFCLCDESIVDIDMEMFNEYTFNFIIDYVLKYPIVCINIINFDKGDGVFQKSIEKLCNRGTIFDSRNRKVYFTNVIWIIQTNQRKEMIGFKKINNSYENFEIVLDDLVIEK